MTSQIPNPTGMNLLITLNYADFSLNPGDNFPGYPWETRDDILNALNKVPHLKSIEEFTEKLEPPTSLTPTLLSTIHSTEANILAPATGDMIIPGFAPDIQQFIVVNPPAVLQKRFDARMNASKGHSLILFHGTSLYNLRGILLKGVLPIYQYLWAAEHPSYSYNYAYRDFPWAVKSWKHTLYKDWGVLLGLEVAGEKIS
jgi:hypothetical protein